jgi:hydrogenase nickel incorporation protein HypB
MCSVCGCGEAKIENITHSHSAEVDVPFGTVVHNHHYHGDVHHHHYYAVPAPHDDAHDHCYDHHHGVSESTSAVYRPHHDGDLLHYGTGDAGVHVTGMSQRQLLSIEQDVLGKNDHLAQHNREHFSKESVLVLNLVSSPGSGKTTLLTETLLRLRDRRVCAVIEGDQQTSNDAERIRETGVPAIQVNTGKGCHLDAQMVHDAYGQLSLPEQAILFVENVGNLVCPASFDLGEKHKVAILSVTEGADKPLKYPDMFAASALMIINKMDLLPYVAFNVNDCIENARRVNPNIQVLTVSATSGEGMETWLNWLESESCA